MYEVKKKITDTFYKHEVWYEVWKDEKFIWKTNNRKEVKTFLKEEIYGHSRNSNNTEEEEIGFDNSLLSE